MCTMAALLPCPGCGGLFPDVDGPTHRYLEATPGCWAAYGVVLAREYSDARYMAVHRLTVDAYAVQHPGQPARQTIRSVGLHLLSLCAVLERGLPPHEATALLQRAASGDLSFRWLDPPADRGRLTVADVQPAEDPVAHRERVQAWAEAAWAAWHAHHVTVAGWLEAV